MAKRTLETYAWQMSGREGVEQIAGAGTINKKLVGGVATSFPVAATVTVDNKEGDTSIDLAVNADTGVVSIDWLGNITAVTQTAGTVTWIYA